MKKLLNILILLSLFNCNSQYDTGKILKENTASKSVNSHKDSLQNKDVKQIQKYGFSFVIPPSFKIIYEDIKSIDRTGNVKSFETGLSSVENQIDIHLIFHPGQSGFILYDYYSKQKNKIEKNISNHDALLLSEILNKNGKGKIINPKKRIRLFIKKRDGVVEVDYSYPIDHTKAPVIWENFLHNIKSL